MSTSSDVTFKTLSARGGFKIGLVSLTRAKSMNALTREMIQAIGRRLARWQQSKRIVAVVIQGEGRCFCSGGDIRQLYDGIADGDETGLKQADQFFELEYKTNIQLHRFTKPLIAWGHGYVMGGGLGLFLTANHRIGTTSMQLAWPEVRIGLFPDVLGSWYLSRIEPALGYWMGLTGMPINSTDALSQRLIDYQMADGDLEPLIGQLRRLDWTERTPDNQLLVRHLLGNWSTPAAADKPESDWLRTGATITEMMVPVIQQGLVALPAADADQDAWVQRGLHQHHAGCPATARLLVAQLALGRHMSLVEAARLELVMAWQACRHPDLVAGIRALLIDRGALPQWQHATPASVPDQWVKALMTSPWKRDEHPFANL
ncbi:enoyl-CoA hydratase/isomerase family protein [Oceanobacter sp. 5_MG-2023]|uniref:enoyl-CoA hydratase/isomerase family protein n=1 Tax=Oceanobacter sp. 5_MG-2023 TaxID=3062645 RepID=UPI0026E2DB5B|nr:enoyl-CoA hydratase/isomerase family protein [Oceanobacter sp. 5_MG-2023]MDO6682596.1 enoyl-CoA hydratase/isomerase family protein [Oceanobacter sp. 5_MG-2023]